MRLGAAWRRRTRRCVRRRIAPNWLLLALGQDQIHSGILGGIDVLSHDRRLRKDQVKDNGHDGGGGHGVGADDGGHPGGHALAGEAAAGHPNTQAKDNRGADDGGGALREALAGEHAHTVHGDGAKDADGRAADDGLRDSGKDGRELREQTGDGKDGRDDHKDPLVDDLVGADDAHVLAKGAGGKTAQQAADIYNGKITNWKDVGGQDLDIVAFQRRSDSGSQTLFQKLLIQDGPLMEAPTELAPTAMGELVDSIAEYNNSANAIGFSVYYYIDQMYSKPGLRLLAVDGVTPSNETIADQSYPLCNEFYAAILQDSAADSPERRIYEWLSTDAGRSCIEHSGYVAVQ